MSEQRQPNNIPTFELRHRLDRAMEEAGLKPEDMVEPIGRGITTIRNYLSGRRRPSRGSVTAWALRCGVDRDWLWNGTPGTSDPGPGQGVSPLSCMDESPRGRSTVVQLRQRAAS